MYFPITLKKAKTVWCSPSRKMKFSIISFFSRICMHLEYSCRSSITIVLLFPVSLKQYTIFSNQLVSQRYKGTSWETLTVGLSDGNELKALQVGNWHYRFLPITWHNPQIRSALRYKERSTDELGASWSENILFGGFGFIITFSRNGMCWNVKLFVRLIFSSSWLNLLFFERRQE